MYNFITVTKRSKKTYILIDTNIFVQCCLLEKKEDDEKSIDSLIKILDENKATLLLPEIVKKEFYKTVNLQSYTEWGDNFKAKIKININQTKGQNDSQDRESKSKNPKNQQSKPIIELSETLSSNFLTNIDTFVSEQIKLFKKIQRKIEVVFNHKNKEVIPFQKKDFFEAYNLYLLGEKPTKSGYAIQSDAVIVSGLYSFLKKKNNYQFLLCSNNTEDFSDKILDGKEGLNSSTNLHFHIKSKIKGESRYYKYLSVLLNNEFGFEIKSDITKEQNIDINTPDSTSELVGKSKII